MMKTRGMFARVASRPGYPAEPAARSRPFGRVSLAPPLPSVAARSACPAARCARRRCRTDTHRGTVRRHRPRRPPCPPRAGAAAPRSSRCSPRSPWPAAPAAGIASARRGGTPCVAGDGFAVHRAPHYAVQSCPHQCGHFRPSLRQRAAHDCLRLRPHRPPLTRRGGFDLPVSPAPVSRTSMLPIGRPGPPGRPWFSHPTHR